MNLSIVEHRQQREKESLETTELHTSAIMKGEPISTSRLESQGLFSTSVASSKLSLPTVEEINANYKKFLEQKHQRQQPTAY